jgi:hypothetical protein
MGIIADMFEHALKVAIEKARVRALIATDDFPYEDSRWVTLDAAERICADNPEWRMVVVATKGGAGQLVWGDPELTGRS